MLTSDRGLKLVKAAEFCSLSAYPDPLSELGEACTHLGFKVTEYQCVPRWQLLKADPVTIGWGHTGMGFKLGDAIPQATADSLLRMDVHFAEYALHGLELNQNQYDALVSLVFNIGGGAFNGVAPDYHKSTLRKLLEQKDYAAAANEFLKWDHVGGQVVQGLLNRRKAERVLFLTPVEGAA